MITVDERSGLHYVEGLPEAVQYGLRGLLFLLAVVCGAMLFGVVSQRRLVERGLWWVSLGMLVICVRFATMQIFRWEVPITLEALLSLMGLAAVAYGLRLRVMSGRSGQ